MKKEYKKKYNLTFTPSVYEKFQAMLGENGLMVSPVLEMQMRVMLNAKKVCSNYLTVFLKWEKQKQKKK